MEKVDILHTNYEKNNVLSKCDDVVLEAKRVLLNEQLDKIANITLSQLDYSRKNIENYAKQCKESVNLKNDFFWEELPPNPKNPTVKFKEPSQIITTEPVDIIGDLIKVKRSESNSFVQKTKSSGNNNLLKKYFFRWKTFTKLKKEQNALIENRLEQKEKLEKFVRKMKKAKKREQNKPKIETPRKIEHQEKPHSGQIYKNRYNAQKNIIDMQKAKLEQQNKLIEELKMGIIREDLLKSIENTKNNIREIFGNCSNKVKCRVPVVIIEQSQEFKINTQKAPKVVQQMEQRALQRAQKREMILERKRLIEEARQRMLEEAIEKKRVLEEEEKKRNLEVIKERRKKEVEQEKIRQANKQKFMENLNKAVNFYNKRLLMQCFKKLYDNYKMGKHNALLAKEHYQRKILRECISCWCDFVEDTYMLKYEIADAHFKYTVFKKVLHAWKSDHIENIRNRQVAEDFHDFRLTSNTFIYWHRYTCLQMMLQDKKIKIGENHYKRRLLFHYFYLWRTLPAVIQLEKSKELKKRKWREKVWDILPDYKPPEDI